MEKFSKFIYFLKNPSPFLSVETDTLNLCIREKCSCPESYSKG